MDTATHKNLENFVRGPLGCNCPDKVFEKIDIIDNCDDFKSALGDELFSSCRLVSIGGILLVLTVEADTAEAIQSNMQAIFEQGKKLRDNQGFNRFRLAVAASNQEQMQEALEPVFESLVGDDEKIHLHVISRQQLPIVDDATLANT